MLLSLLKVKYICLCKCLNTGRLNFLEWYLMHAPFGSVINILYNPRLCVVKSGLKVRAEIKKNEFLKKNSKLNLRFLGGKLLYKSIRLSLTQSVQSAVTT